MKPIRIERVLKSRSADQILTKIEKYAAKRKFVFAQQGDQGEFGARGFQGNFAIEREGGEERLIVEITKRPIVVPESLIVSKTEQRLAAWDSV